LLDLLAALQAVAPAGGPQLDLRDYELLDLLGHGGIGEVYRSRDPGLGRDLALKVLRPQWQGRREVEYRLEQEAHITGSLQHPGIVPVYNLGRLRDGRLYFTMKVVRGRTWAEVLGQPGEQTPQRRAGDVAVFEKVCQAVAYAHSKGVIHRDLKPGNVMVGAFGEVQVMDWGLAKVLARERRRAVAVATVPASSVVQTVRSDDPALQSQEGVALGTYAYMAPEQACGASEQLNERCDVFGLGAVLGEVLTGRPPYTGPTAAVVHDRALRAELGPAWERLDRCGADAELVELAKRCLAVEPAARPGDAGEVAGAVGAYLAGVQLRLREAERQRAAAEVRAVEERKRRRLAIALATAVLLLAGGGGGWLLQQQQHGQQHQRARESARREQADKETGGVVEQGRVLLDEGWKEQDLARLAQATSEGSRAVDIARSGEASEEMRQQADAFQAEAEKRLGRAKKNRALLAALMDVSAPPETRAYTRDDKGRMMVPAQPKPSVGEQYAAAFRGWDLDVEGATEAEVVARLKDEPEAVVQEVIAALDGWMLERRRQKHPEAKWRHLFQRPGHRPGPGAWQGRAGG
jgi:serine/threonine-protein kinase